MNSQIKPFFKRAKRLGHYWYKMYILKSKLLLVMVLLTLLFSCNKKSEMYNNGISTLKVNLQGIEFLDVGDPIQQALSSYKSQKLSSLGNDMTMESIVSIQTIELPFDEDYKIVATLASESNSKIPAVKNKMSTLKKGVEVANLQTLQANLPVGIVYRVIA